MDDSALIGLWRPATPRTIAP